MYFGWFVVAGSALVYMLVIGSTFSAFGLFVVPVAKEFGLSRATMNTALILLNIGNAALAPLVGRMLDRMPARPIMLVSGLLLGGSLVLLGASRSLLLNAFVMAVPLALGVLGAGTITCSVLLARWFTLQRGRAMTLAAIGISLGSVFVTPALGWIIDREGWRAALFLAGTAAAVVIVALSLVLRDRPRSDESERGAPPVAPRTGAIVADKPVSVRALLVQPQLWTIGISVSLATAVTLSIGITMVPLAMGDGLTTLEATTLVSISGISAIAGKFLLAFIADRVDRSLLLTAMFLVGALLSIILALGHNYGVLAGCAVLLGIASGGLAPIFYALLADNFGDRSFGTVRGLVAPMTAITSALIVRMTGEIFDRAGHYTLAFAVFSALFVAAAALMLSTRMYGDRRLTGA